MFSKIFLGPKIKKKLKLNKIKKQKQVYTKVHIQFITFRQIAIAAIHSWNVYIIPWKKDIRFYAQEFHYLFSIVYGTFKNCVPI